MSRYNFKVRRHRLSRSRISSHKDFDQLRSRYETDRGKGTWRLLIFLLALGLGVSVLLLSVIGKF